jgi:hypothetical protein
MLILLGSEHRPKFHINKASSGYFYVMVSYVLVTIPYVACLTKRLKPQSERERPSFKFTQNNRKND